MRIYDTENYKDFVLSKVRALPQAGRGELSRIAKALRMHSTTLSQVMRGDKHLTLEQAQDLCEYFGLGDLETSYFLALVQQEKAGTEKLRNAFRQQLRLLKGESQELVHRLPHQELSWGDSEKAVFYSQWFYSAIRIATALPHLRTMEEIADHFSLPKRLTNEALGFLVSVGLCKEENGKYTYGPMHTHLESRSPFVAKHHINWRLKAMQRLGVVAPHELNFTAPMAIAEELSPQVREILTEAIEKILKLAKESPSEKLACLTIDWFDF